MKKEHSGETREQEPIERRSKSHGERLRELDQPDRPQSGVRVRGSFGEVTDLRDAWQTIRSRTGVLPLRA